MRSRRLLLVALALTGGCDKGKPVEKVEPVSEPLPGNPKGAVYDANAMDPGTPIADDAAITRDAKSPRDAGAPADDARPSRDAAPRDASAPADDARPSRDAAPRDASAPVDDARADAGPTDAGAPRDAASPRDAGRKPPPRDSQLYTNPKGSFYDTGLE